MMSSGSSALKSVAKALSCLASWSDAAADAAADWAASLTEPAAADTPPCGSALILWCRTRLHACQRY